MLEFTPSWESGALTPEVCEGCLQGLAQGSWGWLEGGRPARVAFCAQACWTPQLCWPLHLGPQPLPAAAWGIQVGKAPGPVAFMCCFTPACLLSSALSCPPPCSAFSIHCLPFSFSFPLLSCLTNTFLFSSLLICFLFLFFQLCHSTLVSYLPFHCL